MLVPGEMVWYRLHVTWEEGDSSPVTLDISTQASGACMHDLRYARIIHVGENLNFSSNLLGMTGIVMDNSNKTYDGTADTIMFYLPAVRNAWDNVVDNKDNITIEFMGVVASRAVSGASSMDVYLDYAGDTDPASASIVTRVARLVVDKKCTPPARAEFGNLVYYTVSVVHDDTSIPIYNLTLTDLFTPLLSLVPGSLWVNNGSIVSGNSVGDTAIRINFTETYRPGDAPIRFTYTANLTQLIPFDGTVTNIAYAAFQCNPSEDFNANQTKIVTFSDDSEVDTPVPLNVPTFGFSSLNTTRFTGLDNPVAIGETVTIYANITLPKGTSYTSRLVIEFTSGVFPILSSRVYSIPRNMRSSFLVNGSVGTYRDLNYGDGFFDEVTFNFGNVTNSYDDWESDALMVEVVFLVKDHLVTNQNNFVRSIRYDWRWNNLESNEEITRYLYVTTVTSVLSVTKTVTNSIVWEAEAIVDYLITITHATSSKSAAFEIELYDNLTNIMDLVPGSVNISAGYLASGNNTGDKSLYAFPGLLQLGTSITIAYKVKLRLDTNPGSVTRNYVHVKYYDSLLSNPEARNHSLSIYNDLILTPTTFTNFSIYNSSDPGTSDADKKMTIGEVVVLRAHMNVPQGIMPQAVAAFELPYGTNGYLAIVSTTIVRMSSNFNSSTGLTQGSNSTYLDRDNDGFADAARFVFGNLTNYPDGKSMDANDTIVLEVTFLVRNHTYNYLLLGEDFTMKANLTYANSRGYIPPVQQFNIQLYYPTLAVKKVGISTAPFVDAGTVIHYTLTIDHVADSNSPAYNVALGDQLVPVFDIQNRSVKTTSGTVISGNAPGDSLIVVHPLTMQPRTTVVVTYTLMVNNSVNSGSTINDSCTLYYQSTIGDGKWNANDIKNSTIFGHYSLTIPPPILYFAINSSSLVETQQHQVAIGELMSWYVTVDLVQGTTANATLTVSVAKHVNSTETYFGIISSAVISMATNIKSSTGIVQWSNGTPRDIDGDNVADTVEYYFGDIVNEPEGVFRGKSDMVLVEVVVLVTQNGSLDGQTYKNNAWFNYTKGSENLLTVLDLYVVEPDLQVIKTSRNPSAYLEAGLSVQYVIVVKHTADSKSPAFNVSVTDLLTPDLKLQSGTVHTTSGDIFKGNGGNDATVNIIIPVILLGGNVTIVYNATTTNIVQASAPFKSLVRVNYTSAPATVVNSAEVKNYTTTDEWPLTIADPIISLDLIHTSVPTTEGADVTVGEQVVIYANLIMPQGIISSSFQSPFYPTIFPLRNDFGCYI